ncbi:lipid IV(A) 3-deoxy-D-manno-octulosonic acid transferase [Candidatus Thiothrix sp. Deng01]|uniref:3-deoxy-D-manno-octulosonic acid transferase n=1 Tax=Candidatus Thiothrix phosphatis TaxID=3112415 RepID=A0ABU6CY16_9GAMM|nr:lipid IV(A) 3-deoxy-D-manno-octulosonic acid transferase [Candidatus Thiothrix sp. Deng01]MEB4590962.1 lipid IV(A) 3-deoxy-D-manno-octulosonic acid transferase [Candidatus Thiothrix sp. Deng01]
MSIRRFLYSLLMYGLTPLFVLRLLWRSRANPAYRRRLGERFGFVPVAGRPCIWLHAVSVGETIAARPLIGRLLQEYPQHPLLVTTTTPTGSDTVKRLFGEKVLHYYFPYDLPDALARFLNRMQPQLLVVMETEIWPNLYATCTQRRIPLLLANARLSARSTQGYARIASLVRETLAHAQVIATRDRQDSQRFQQLGARPEQLRVCGNIKFDLQVPDAALEQGRRLRSQWGGQRPVWVAASTHQGEDDIILRVFARLREQSPELLLVLVPRHPERFEAVAALCADSGLPVARRSAGGVFPPETAIVVGDSMGEMLLWYAAADVAFIGGSLVAHGGHNPLEAAAFGVPVVSGEHVHNFADIFPALCDVGGAVLVPDEAGLAAQLLVWLQDAAAQQCAGQAAKQFFQQNQGAVDCLIHAINTLMKTSGG